MNLIAFDTETVENSKREKKFFSFQAYSLDTETYIYSESISDLKKLFNEENRGSMIFAHFLEFDFSIIREWLEENFDHLELRYAGSRLISIACCNCVKVNGKERMIARYKLYDSMNYYPMALEKVGKIINVKKLEKPSFLGKRGYETQDEKKEFIAYAMQDVVTLYHAMKEYDNTVEGCIKSTSASSSYRFFDTKIQSTKDWKITTWLNNDVRRSYYGGRVEAFYRGMVRKENFGTINCYDFNSLYPSVMLGDMPDLTKYPTCLKGKFDNEKLGSVLCDVKIDCQYPLLPVREDKLKFKCGVVSGWYTIPEINELERSGEGKVLKVYKSYNWEKVPSYFKEYIMKFYNERKKLILEGSEKEKLLKLLMNSLYGKFGEVIEPLKYVKINSLTDFKNAYDIKGNYAVMKGESKYSSHTYFPIASTITAYGRIKLHNKIHQVVDVDKKEVFYCDTDSIFTNGIIPDSTELGEMKLEKDKVKDWYCFIRAKAYMNDTCIKLKGSPKKVLEKNNEGVKKEVKLTSEMVLKCLRNDKNIAFEYDTMNRFRDSMNRNLEPMATRESKKEFLTVDDGKRLYEKALSSKQLVTSFSTSKPIGY